MSATTITKRDAFAYLRCGSSDQRDCQVAFEHQWRTCERYARRRGLRITRVYVDPGASGNIPRRPSLDGMLHKLSLGRAHHLVMADDYRLARDMMLQLALQLEIARYGVAIITSASDPEPYQPRPRRERRCR
jgi:DNA invertase Pin-like site-specific DNA recombinase